MSTRWLARAILKAGVRMASPEAREWGQAMLRELDFVPGDWAPLWWALGSVGALFQAPHAPLQTAEDVLCRAKALRRETRRRNLVGNVACGLAAGGFASFTFEYANWMQETGSVLTVVVSTYLMFQLAGVRSGRIPAGDAARLEYYRAELVRQRDFHRGNMLWARLFTMIPGYLMFCLGLVIAHPGSLRPVEMSEGCFLFLLVLAVPLNLRLARKYQRQLEDLEAFRKKLG